MLVFFLELILAARAGCGRRGKGRKEKGGCNAEYAERAEIHSTVILYRIPLEM